jgi:hypothetical protein
MKRLGRAGATMALALIACTSFCDNSVADDLSVWITWDDAYWQISGADEAAAIVANTQAVTEAHALVSQILVNNVVNEQDVTHTSLVQGSFNDSAGIIGINQSTGSSNNQANVRAFAVAPGLGALQDAQADVTMEMHDNSITTSGGSLTAGIDHSFNNTAGVVAVNQVAGSLNEQANVLALSMGQSAGQDSIILDDATLALVGTPDQNTANEDPNRPQHSSMTDSFNGFTGIAQVNQVAGDLNRVNNVMAVSIMAMP